MRLAASRSTGPNRCALFVSAGLLDVQVTALEVPTVFADLDVLWQPFVGGQVPAPGYCSSLPEARRYALREQLSGMLPRRPGGSTPVSALAWAVRGFVPDRTVGSPAQHRVGAPAPHAGSGSRARLGELSPVKTFDSLYDELAERASTRPAGSGTVQALDAGVHAQGKKLLEEAGEVWLAAEHEGDDALALEISQLLYRAQVIMIGRGITLEQVYRHL